MTADEILLWRRSRKMTQSQFAAALGVDRKTVNRWETGKHHAPLNIHNKLASIVIGKPMHELFVCKEMKGTRPDLKLYNHFSFRKNDWFADEEHPRHILPDIYGSRVFHGKIPIEVLDSPEYLQALAAFRKARSAKRRNHGG